MQAYGCLSRAIPHSPNLFLFRRRIPCDPPRNVQPQKLNRITKLRYTENKVKGQIRISPILKMITYDYETCYLKNRPPKALCRKGYLIENPVLIWSKHKSRATLISCYIIHHFKTIILVAVIDKSWHLHCHVMFSTTPSYFSWKYNSRLCFMIQDEAFCPLFRHERFE